MSPVPPTLPALPGALLALLWVAAPAMARTGEDRPVMTDGGEDLFGDGGDLDLEDGDDLDLEGGDDLDLGGGGDLDALDTGEGDDGGDLGGGGGGGGADLAPRVDELEADIEDLRSTLSSTEHENEQIRESLDHIEDNIRKLLDVYGIVTKGANPFVDAERPEIEAGKEKLDVFEELSEGEDTDAEDTDELKDAMEDDEDDEDDAEEPRDELEDDAEEALDELEDDAEEPRDDEKEDDEAEAEDATTFDDLKEEYESDEEPEDEADEDDGTDETTEDKSDREAIEDEEDEDAIEDEEDGDDETGFEFGRGREEKPYLDSLPDGFGNELVVMEWLEYLVANSDFEGATRAIRRYRSIGWISGPVAERLETALVGVDADDAAEGGLTREHHLRSLEYVTRLGDGPGNPGLPPQP